MPLLKRLQEGGLRAHLLQVQYRMHPDIAAFPAHHFYGGAVKSAVEPQDRPLVKVGAECDVGEGKWAQACTGQANRHRRLTVSPTSMSHQPR